MSKKVVRLTESQLRLMINRVINEQTAPVAQNNETPTIVFTVDFGTTFQSGQYELNTSNQQEINNKVTQLVNFIKDKQLKDFKVVIYPGESQVTNQPPFDKVKGSLAAKRGEILKTYLGPILQRSLNITPTIDVAPPKIGDTPYGGPGSGDSKNTEKIKLYTIEQFVKVSIVISGQIPPKPTPTPTLPPPEKTEFMISWTLDKRCDRVKYFKTYAEMSVMVNKLKAAGYNTSQSETRGGGVPWSASVKLQQLSQDPPSGFFDGPFFDSCEQKFVGRK